MKLQIHVFSVCQEDILWIRDLRSKPYTRACPSIHCRFPQSLIRRSECQLKIPPVEPRAPF